MHGGQRERYLAALGIVRYRRRSEITAVVGESREGQASQEAEPRFAEGGVPEVAAPVDEGKPKSTAPAAVSSEGSGGAPMALLAPMRLACWRPAADLLVLNALPCGQRPDRQSLTLLANMLRAIGRQPESLEAPEFFDWPLLPGGDTALAAAHEALAVFLAGRMAKEPFRWALVMGEPAWRWLAGSAPDLTPGVRLAVAGGQAQAILVPGLAEMLAAPHLKALAWQAIRALVGARG